MAEIPEKEDNPLFKNLKKDFLYGLFVILPLIATTWLVWFIINFISGPLSSIFGKKIPLPITFLLSLVIITLIGIATRHLIGKMILTYVEELMNRIPIMGSIYNSTKQIVNAFTLKNKKLLSAVLVEYPRKGVWALAFVTRESSSGLLDKEGTDIGEGKVSLFVPTTPNPTSGYFIFVNKEDIIELSMSIEDSIKVLMSAGVIAPKIRRRKKIEAEK